MSDKKPGFEVKDIPNAILGIFGVRTEKEVGYKTLQKEGAFEIRELAAHTELSIQRSGSRKEAGNAAFDELFAYIKGANGSKKKYAMTAPVWEESLAPDKWQTSFYIDDGANLEPVPDNPSLHLNARPASRFAVYRFNGSATDTEVEAAVTELKRWLTSKSLDAKSQFRLAQFDPPFALPLLRRNEIQIELA